MSSPTFRTKRARKANDVETNHDKTDGIKMHKDSPAEGDLILHGDDDIGVRFHSFHLKSHR